MLHSVLQDFEGDRIAMSLCKGELALLRRQENCIVLYGKEATEIPEQHWELAIFIQKAE